MKSIVNYTLAITLIALVSCGQKDELAEKRAELNEYKTDMQELKTQIAALESEIADLDPDFAQQNRKSTLITTIPVAKKDFKHFIEVAGEVTSRQNIQLTAEVSGLVDRIAVQEGREVRKGEILLQLDASTAQRTIDELQTSLELATTVFQRQSNLWDQKIGTEIQYLEAKNRKESIERQLASLRTQLNKSVIRAPFSGAIEEIIVKQGETAMVGTPLLQLVGSENMFVQADVSEAYSGNFEKGDSVELQFPGLNETYGASISSIGRVINKENRTFTVEVKLPKAVESGIKPNQLAVVKIKDFEKEGAIIVPTNLIQGDNKGEFVYIVDKSDKIKIAKKVHIKRGITYKNETLIESGLTGNELLIDQGFREVGEGLSVKQAQTNL